MNEPIEDGLCYRCGGEMEDGFAKVVWPRESMLEKPRFLFVIPGEPTSLNPLVAFKQGLEQAPEDDVYVLTGRRCVQCGLVELFATERTSGI